MRWGLIDKSMAGNSKVVARFSNARHRLSWPFYDSTSSQARRSSPRLSPLQRRHLTWQLYCSFGEQPNQQADQIIGQEGTVLLSHKYWYSADSLLSSGLFSHPHSWQQQHSINDHPNTSPHLIQRYAGTLAHARAPLARAIAMVRLNKRAGLEHL